MNIIVCPLDGTHHTAWIDLMFTSKPKLILMHGQMITELYNRMVPLRTTRVTKPPNPWLKIILFSQ
ncbi:hypothetical protein PR048_003097 [Dryococelus australis]|uniref:Uncharacterized protein n=1 Tax=Dryococelus australis TaxID=614101 RepID=A0ABQ9IM38_9NEOP|nr:hypothetical protein PR048_003097 [Dryococelus australis]